MRILVTGPMGYVGNRVGRALASRGHTVVALLRPTDVDEGLRGLGFHVARAELTDLDGLRRETAAVDGVFHGAASASPSFGPVSAAAVEVFLETLSASGAFAMQAGSGVFGDTGTRTFDGTETPAPPPPLDAASRLERRILASGTPARRYVVYAPLVYGGRGAMIPNALLSAARALGKVPVVGAGANRWSTVFVDDWADLIAGLLEAGPEGGHPFVAASGEVSMRQLAEALSRALGTPGDVVPLSVEEASASLGFFAPLLAIDQRFSGARATQATGWAPRGPSLFDEIDRLVHA